MANNLLVDWLNKKPKTTLRTAATPQSTVNNNTATNAKTITTPTVGAGTSLSVQPKTVPTLSVQQPVQPTATIQSNNPAFNNGALVTQNNQPSRFIGFQQQPTAIEKTADERQGLSWRGLMNGQYAYVPTTVNQAIQQNANEEQRYRTAEQVIKDFAWDVKNSNGTLKKSDITKYYKEFEGNEDAALQLQADILPLVQQGQFPDMNWVSQTYGELLKGKDLKDIDKVKEESKKHDERFASWVKALDKVSKSGVGGMSSNGVKSVQDATTIWQAVQSVKKQGVVGGGSDYEILNALYEKNPEIKQLMDEFNSLELTDKDKAIWGRNDASAIRKLLNEVTSPVREAIVGKSEFMASQEELESMRKKQEAFEDDYWGQTRGNIRTSARQPYNSFEKFLYRMKKDAKLWTISDIDEYLKQSEQNEKDVQEYNRLVDYEQERLENKYIDPDVRDYYNSHRMTQSLALGDLKGFIYKSAGEAAGNWEMPLIIAAGVVAPEVTFPLMATDTYVRESEDAFEQLQKAGASYDDAEQGAVLVGLASTAVELWLEKAIGGVETTASKAIREAIMKDVSTKTADMVAKNGLVDLAKKGLTTQLKSSFEEGLEEIVQQAIQNYAVSKYNPNQKITEGLLESFEGGFFNPMNLLAGGGDIISNIDTETLNQGAYNLGVRTRNVVDNAADSLNRGAYNAEAFLGNMRNDFRNNVTSQGGINNTQQQGGQTEVNTPSANQHIENGGWSQPKKGVIGKVASGIGKAYDSTIGKGINYVAEKGAEVITDTSTPQDKLFQAVNPSLNKLTNKRGNYNQKRQNADRTNELIIEYGYTPTNSVEYYDALIKTKNTLWKNEIQRGLDTHKYTTVKSKELTNAVRDAMQEDAKFPLETNKSDLAKLNKELASLDKQGELSLEQLEAIKQQINAKLNYGKSAEAGEIYEKGLRAMNAKIGEIEDQLIANLPGQFAEFKKDYGALKNMEEDVLKMMIRDMKKKDGGGLTQNIGRLAGIGKLLSSPLEGTMQIIFGEVVGKARETNFLIQKGFEDLRSQYKGQKKTLDVRGTNTDNGGSVTPPSSPTPPATPKNKVTSKKKTNKKTKNTKKSDSSTDDTPPPSGGTPTGGTPTGTNPTNNQGGTPVTDDTKNKVTKKSTKSVDKKSTNQYNTTDASSNTSSVNLSQNEEATTGTKSSSSGATPRGGNLEGPTTAFSRGKTPTKGNNFDISGVKKEYSDNYDKVMNGEATQLPVGKVEGKVAFDGKERDAIFSDIIRDKVDNDHGIDKSNVLGTLDKPDYIIKNMDGNENKINIIRKIPGTNNYVLLAAERQNGFFIVTNYEVHNNNSNRMMGGIKRLAQRGELSIDNVGDLTEILKEQPKNAITSKKSAVTAPKQEENSSDLKNLVGDKFYNYLQRQVEIINESRRGIKEPITIDDLDLSAANYAIAFERIASEELEEARAKLEDFAGDTRDTSLTPEQQKQLKAAKNAAAREKLLEKWRAEYLEAHGLTDEQIEQVEAIMQEIHGIVEQHKKAREYLLKRSQEKADMQTRKQYEDRAAVDMYNEEQAPINALISLYEDMNIGDDALESLFGEIEAEERFMNALDENQTPQDIDYQALAELENETPQMLEEESTNKVTSNSTNKVTNGGTNLDKAIEIIKNADATKPQQGYIGEDTYARASSSDVGIKTKGDTDFNQVSFYRKAVSLSEMAQNDTMFIVLNDVGEKGIENVNKVLEGFDLQYRVGSELDNRGDTVYYLENTNTGHKDYFSDEGRSEPALSKTLRDKTVVPRLTPEQQAEYDKQMEQRRKEQEAERERERQEEEKRKEEEAKRLEEENTRKTNLLTYVNDTYGDNPLQKGRVLKELSELNEESDHKIRYYGDEVPDNAEVWQVLDALADLNGSFSQTRESGDNYTWTYNYGDNRSISRLTKTQKNYLEYRMNIKPVQNRLQNYLDNIENKSLRTRTENVLNKKDRWKLDDGKIVTWTKAQYIEWLVNDLGYRPKEFPTGKTYANGEPKIDYMIVNEKNAGYISSKIENGYAKSLLETPEEELSAEDGAKLEELFTPKTTTEITGEKNAVTAKTNIRQQKTNLLSNGKNKITNNKADSKMKKQIKKDMDQLMKTGLVKGYQFVKSTKDLYNLINGTTTQPRYQSVWHGGGNFKKFDLSHAGEGEGNAAHGYGIYVTENEARARAYGDLYRNNKYGVDIWGGNGQFVTYKGETLDQIDGENASLIRRVIEGMQSENLANPYYSATAQIAAVKKGLKSQQMVWGEKGLTSESSNAKYKNDVEFLDNLNPKDFKVQNEKRNLYSVEIPDKVKADTPTGWNYLEEGVNNTDPNWKDAFITPEQVDKFVNALKNYDEVAGQKLADKMYKKHRVAPTILGADIYKELSRVLGSDEEASKFLNKIGYDGIHYIGKEDGSSYVIFNEDSLNINEHIKYLKDNQGNVAGATLPDGTIVFVEDALRPDTAFHETSHRLVSFAKENNPELYSAINKIAEEAPQELKDYVKETYGDLSPEAFIDEVFAWQQGKYSAIKGAETWYQKMWNAIKRLWNNIRSKFGKQYADLSVFEGWEKMNSEQLMKEVDKLLKGGKEVGEGKGNKSYQIKNDAVDSKGKSLTPEQQMFFADSKVRDSDGNLLRVYHGTLAGDFTVYEKGKNGMSNSIAKVGHRFTPNKEGAINFAKESYRGDSEARADEVYLNITNPKVYEPSKFNLLSQEEKVAERDKQWDIYKKKDNLANGKDYTYRSGFFDDEYDHPYYERAIFEDLKRKYEYDKQYNGKFGKYDPEEFRRLAEEYNRSYDANLDYDKIVKDFTEYEKLKEDAQKEYEKYLDMTHDDPYEDFMYDIYKIDSTMDRKWTKKDLDMALNSYESPNKYVEKLKAEGYDGIIIKGTEYDGAVIGGGARNDQYVVFDSNQIKRITNENPTSNPDIRYQKNILANGKNKVTTNAAAIYNPVIVGKESPKYYARKEMKKQRKGS